MITKNKIIHLNLTSGLGPAAIFGYIQKLNPDLLGSLGFANVRQLSQENFVKINNELQISKTMFDEELQLIEKHKINVTTILDSDYPEILKGV